MSAFVFLASSILYLCRYTHAGSPPTLTQQQEQVFRDRLYQTNLRGPRWTGNDNQNTLTALVAESFAIAGLDVQTLDYNITRWDPRWWSLSVNLKNGTNLGLETTGYWPYSGDSGLVGVTAPIIDAGTYGINDAWDPTGDPSTLSLTQLANYPEGAIIFFDNPSPTRNYSSPGYDLLGTSNNISTADIPELGNLTNPHWQSAKTLNFTAMKEEGVLGVLAAWVNTSDANGALQYLPNDGAPGDGNLYDVPSLYVGMVTGETIRGLISTGQIENVTIVLDAPSIVSTSQTVIGHLHGAAGGNETIIIYTHSDGPSIIEENGPILLLSMAEALAKQRPNIDIHFVVTTGHVSGGHLNESMWMDQVPEIMANAKAAVACEHFGAIEWKDNFSTGEPVYQPTGMLEPMWTMANGTVGPGDILHDAYIDAFEGTSESLRMALIAPQVVNGTRAKWYGVGGSSTLGYSTIPMIGIIPQPDYLWAAMVDGGWSRLNMTIAIEQVNVILELITTLDEKITSGLL